MGQILGLITEKLTTLADAHDRDTLRRKYKAITALFPYAAWQERDKQYPILDVFLLAAKTSWFEESLWYHIQPFLEMQLNGTGYVSPKRAIMFASPYMPWGEDLIQAWAAVVSTIPKEEEAAPSVVDALFRIAWGWSHCDLGDVWSWLTLRPSLPPKCRGRRMGSDSDVVKVVRNLKNIEILKSYLLLVWSEWNSLLDGLDMMCDSIREDFGGIEMCPHRADLVERLDHVLGQLDRGLEYLQQDGPELDEDDLERRKEQYGKLKEVLLEVDRKVLEALT